MSQRPDPPIPPLLRRLWPVILLAIVAAIPLYRAIFSGEAIGPFDQMQWMSPWHGKQSSQPWDILQADSVLQFYVWRDLVFEAYGKGQLPFWNSYQLAGTPLMANSQSGVFYPPHILMGLLHMGTATAITLLAWFHLFWAGLGAYFLSRRLGATRFGAAIAGCSFSLSSFMVSWTALPSVIETVSWLPWILGLIVALFDLSSDADRKSRFKLAAGLAVSTGMMILAGHLQFVAYGFLAAALFVIWLLATRPRPEILRSILPVVVALGLGVAFAAPQLLPVLQYGQFSHRRNTANEDGYQAFVGGAIQPYELIKVAAPSIQGNPRQGLDDPKLPPISTYYPALIKRGANFAESAVGLGVFALALLCALPMLLRRKEALGGVLTFGLVGFLIALGTPINRLFYFLVPGWSSTGSPGRAICLFVLAGCVGAGLAASRIHELTADPKKLKISAGILAAILFVFVVISGGAPVPDKIPAELLDILRSEAFSGGIRAVLGIAVVSGLALYLYGKENSLRSRALILLVPILSGVAFLDTVLVETGTPMPVIDAHLGTKRIAPINSDWDLLLQTHDVLVPNLSAYNRIHSLDGYDSLIHRDTVALLKDIDNSKDGPTPPANGNMMFIKPTADFKKLADAGVSEVWSAKPLPGLSNPVQEDQVFKYKLDGPGRASTPAGPAEIVSETPSQLKVHAQGPGKLIVRERNMPGWMAKVDGAHAALGGTTWMEIDLSTGGHDVELNYVPPGFMSGVFCAVGAFVLALLLGISAYLLDSRGKKAF